MRKKFKTKFATGRIKKIMQSDEEVGKIATAAPILISKCLEIFVHDMITNSMDIAKEHGVKTVNSQHIKACIMDMPQFDFLTHLVEEIPELPPPPKDEEEEEGFTAKKIKMEMNQDLDSNNQSANESGLGDNDAAAAAADMLREDGDQSNDNNDIDDNEEEEEEEGDNSMYEDDEYVVTTHKPCSSTTTAAATATREPILDDADDLGLEISVDEHVEVDVDQDADNVLKSIENIEESINNGDNAGLDLEIKSSDGIISESFLGDIYGDMQCISDFSDTGSNLVPDTGNGSLDVLDIEGL